MELYDNLLNVNDILLLCVVFTDTGVGGSRVLDDGWSNTGRRQDYSLA
mgnify:CR=1 FL=1